MKNVSRLLLAVKHESCT